MRIHAGDKSFKCDYPGCNHGFSDSANLARHIRTHTGEKLFKCDWDGCDKAFATSGNLTAHKRVHTGERPFACDHPNCDKTFVHSDALKVHKRGHTGEKPFKCEHPGCDKEFVARFALTTHKRSHTGERPFKCTHNGCEAAFTQSAHLAVHQAVHTPQGKQRRKLQEQAMHQALVMGNYTQTFETGRVPGPGHFAREVYFDHRCALARNFMPGEKKFAYVDFVVTTPDGRVVFLEVDEDQHTHYPQLCETTRMWNICESIALADLGGDMNVFWLRVNPDAAFRVAGGIVASPRKDRFVEVVKFLDALKSAPDDPPMQIGYAFYDCHPNGRPLALDDPEYHNNVKSAVVCISKGSHRLVAPQPFAPVNPLFAPIDWSVVLDEPPPASAD